MWVNYNKCKGVSPPSFFFVSYEAGIPIYKGRSMLELITSGGRPAGPVPQGYTDFVTYAQAHSSKQLTSAQTLNAAGASMYIAATLDPAAPGSTTMYASPFRDAVWWGAAMYRIACHAAPTLDIWNELSASKRVVLLHTGKVLARTGGWNGLNRNGFSSQSYAQYTSGYPIDDFIYWDNVLGKVMRSNPSKQEVVGTPFNGILLS